MIITFPETIAQKMADFLIKFFNFLPLLRNQFWKSDRTIFSSTSNQQPQLKIHNDSFLNEPYISYWVHSLSETNTAAADTSTTASF